VLGDSAAGVVEAVGPGVTDWSAGDEVVVQTGMNRLGCHAEYVVAKATAVARKPASLSFEDAAALPFGGYTALSFLDRVTVGEGTRVLVNGATGAVGSIVVQLAGHAGATVTAVCSGTGAELARSLGAARVIDYTREDFATGDEQNDVIVDCVGNAPVDRARHVLADGGALLLVVADVPSILGAKRASKRIGGLVAPMGTSLPVGQTLRTLMDKAASGELRAVIDSVYDIDDIVEAHRRVDTGRKRGNVIVRVG
jgi:NADPH:quinone reductase-like Zn-dependent oxidoreductase